MLAPDAATATRTLTGTFTAAEVITIYAGAMRYVVGPMIDATSAPGWFAPVKTTVDRAVANGAGWMDDLCIDLTTAIPDQVIGFSDRFADMADQMTNLETEITIAGGQASAAQRKQAIAGFTRLQDDMRKIDTALKDDHRRLSILMTAIQSDQKALGAAAQTISGNMPDGLARVTSIEVDLGDDYLSCTPNGPCMVNVALNEDVRLKIDQAAGDAPELMPYAIARTLIAKALKDNANAALAFSRMRSIWGYMAGLVDGALEDLGKGAAKDVPRVLREAEFNAAAKVWAALATTASDLKTDTTSPQPSAQAG